MSGGGSVALNEAVFVGWLVAGVLAAGGDAGGDGGYAEGSRR
jgi:hypothetical protein